MSKKANALNKFHTPTFDCIFLGTVNTPITTTASSLQTSAVGANTTVVRVFCTQDCFIAIGSNPTASSATTFLPGGIVEYFSITGGHKVAVIQNTASGTFYMTEGA